MNQPKQLQVESQHYQLAKTYLKIGQKAHNRFAFKGL